MNHTAYQQLLLKSTILNNQPKEVLPKKVKAKKKLKITDVQKKEIVNE